MKLVLLAATLAASLHAAAVTGSIEAGYTLSGFGSFGSLSDGTRSVRFSAFEFSPFSGGCPRSVPIGGQCVFDPSFNYTEITDYGSFQIPMVFAQNGVSSAAYGTIAFVATGTPVTLTVTGNQFSSHTNLPLSVSVVLNLRNDQGVCLWCESLVGTGLSSGINLWGQVDDASFKSVTFQLDSSPVPEPSSWAFMVAGVAALFVARRRFVGRG